MKEIDAQPRRASRLFRNMPKASGFALIVFSIGLAQAAPEAGSVAAGSATIVRSTPQRTDIVQQSHRAVIDWRSFSVNANEHVNFRQPSAHSSTLNRVTGGISQIHGRVSANGQLFLVNPHGIVFGKDAKIDVAGLVASTANIANADFMAGNYRFSDALDRSARIVNRGEINVAEGGFAALVAPGVENSGVIRARLGRIALASGNAFHARSVWRSINQSGSRERDHRAADRRSRPAAYVFACPERRNLRRRRKSAPHGQCRQRGH